MQSTFESIAARVRNGFSSAVLGATSEQAPASLDYRLPLAHRTLITLVAFAIGAALAYLTEPFAGALAALFYFPALTIAGLAGGAILAIPFYALAVLLVAVAFSNGAGTFYFAVAAAIQLAATLFLRSLFQESRRWGLRYRRLISAIAAATAISDASGRMTRPQPELGRLLGRDWPDYSGHRWLETVHPDDRGLLPSEMSDAVGMHRAEVRLMTAGANDWRWHLLRATPLLGNDGKVEEWVYLITDIHSRRIGQEQSDLVLGEQRHRLKNLMTIIRSLAKSTQPRGDQAIEGFLNKFFGRLDALTIAAEEVMARDNKAIEVGAVVRATLSPFMEDGHPRVTVQGPNCLLSEQTGGLVALGIHELATNAIKYGALSVPDGKIAVTWSCAGAIGGERITLDWRESDGPPAAPPEREGFGSRILRFVPAHERDGKVDIDFRPEGLHCRISFVQEPVRLNGNGE